MSVRGIVSAKRLGEKPRAARRSDMPIRNAAMRSSALKSPASSAARPMLRLSSRNRRSEEHTSELQSLMRISYAVFCLKKKTNHDDRHAHRHGSSSLTHMQTDVSTSLYRLNVRGQVIM